MASYAADLQSVCGCAWAVTGSSTDELVSKVKKHAKDVHGINELPQDLVQKFQKAVRPAI